MRHCEPGVTATFVRRSTRDVRHRALDIGLHLELDLEREPVPPAGAACSLTVRSTSPVPRSRLTPLSVSAAESPVLRGAAPALAL